MRFALLAGLLAMMLGAPSAAHADSSVLTYHGSLDRSGRYVVPGLTYERARGLHLDASFHAAYRGGVYAQPLFWERPGSGGAMLIVATDQDEVYAIDAKSGAQIWERTLGEPVPRSALPCGNLPTLGVTGTPVIDPARATLYLDAMVMRDNEPRHEIYALALADGSIAPGWPVDVATALKGSFTPSVYNERGALALFEGRVFVPYSGHFGDCGDYHGVVVGVSQSDPTKVESFSTRARGGGIWGQGGVTGDGKSLFVDHRQYIRRQRMERWRSRAAPWSEPRASDGRPRLFRPLELEAARWRRPWTSAERRRSRSTSRPPKAFESSSSPSARPATPIFSTATISAASAAALKRARHGEPDHGRASGLERR